jgi:predicted phage terminase large subunit-like protein
LWKARYNKEDIDGLKAKLGSYGAAGQLQQRPAPREGGIIKLEWIKTYKELPEVKMYSWTIDSAIKTGSQNDFTVMQYWAMTESGYYLVHMIRQKLEYPELKKVAMSAFVAYPASEVLIEDKSSGQQLIQEFQRWTKIPVISMRPGRDMLSTKDERLRQVSPLYEAGKVFAKADASWLIEYMDELSSFPSAPHDDIVDAATQYLSRRQNKSGEIKVRFI